MQQISSRGIFFQKVIFPLFWFGIVAGMFVFILLTSGRAEGPPIFALIVPVILGVFGYFMLKKMVWDLADAVFDAGDSLVIRFGNDEDRIPLAHIINVSYAYLMSPPRVTLTLRSPGRFGNEISFGAPTRFLPFARSPQIVDLIQRVDAARRVAGASG